MGLPKQLTGSRGWGWGEWRKVGRKKPPGLARPNSCFPWPELGFLLRFLPRDSSCAGRCISPSVQAEKGLKIIRGMCACHPSGGCLLVFGGVSSKRKGFSEGPVRTPKHLPLFRVLGCREAGWLLWFFFSFQGSPEVTLK